MEDSTREFEAAWIMLFLEGFKFKLVNRQKWGRNHYSSEMGQRKVRKGRWTRIGCIMMSRED